MNRQLRNRYPIFALFLAICITGHAQVPEWPDSVAGHVVPARTAGLMQGPMLGRPSAHSVRVWVRTEKPMEFEVRYATALPLAADSPSVHGRTEAARDNIGLVDLTGLKPYQTYYYGVVLDGEGPGYQFIPYPHPQVIVTWHDGYSGDPVYSETISTLDLEEAPTE